MKNTSLLKLLGALLFLLIFTSSFAELIDLTYVKTSSEIVIIVSFTKPPTVQYYSKNGSKTVHFFVVNDTCVSPIYLPINAESVDAVQVIPFRDAVNLFAYTLTPVSATYNVTGSRLYIRLPLSTSKKRMTANFTNLKSEVVFKDLADFFGINLVLYDSAKGKLVNIKANNSTIEQILRNLITLTGLSYAYSEDQTLYVGSQEDIEKTFAMNFQLPSGKVSVEELSKLFTESIYALPLSDKSKLFTYGGSNEYKILASAIGLAAREAAKKMEPKPAWYYFSYTADEKELEGFLEKLKKIYDFDFVLLPEIKQLALNGTDYEKVQELVKTLKPAQKPAIESQYKTFTTEYPQRVAEFLKQLYKDINVEVIGDKLYVSADYENVVKRLLEDPVIARPWKVMFSDISEDIVRAALSYLDIAEPNYIVKSYDNTVYVTLFVNEKKYKEFLDLVNTMSFTTATVKVDEAFLKSFNVVVVQTFSDGSRLVKGKIKEIERLKKAIEESITNVVIKAEPSDPSKDVISKVLGYPVDITTDGYWIITVPKQEYSTIQEKFKNIRENFGKSIITLSGRYDENAVEIAKKIYGVEIYTLSDRLIIYGSQAQNTREFLEKLTVENFIVPVQISLSNVHIDYVKKVYDVEIIYFPEMNKAVVFGPTERALRAAAYLKSLTIQTDLESLKLPSSLKKEDLEKLSSLLELNVKIEVIGDTVYLKGSKNDIEKLVKEINKLSLSPEMIYDVISYDESLDEILRKLYNVQTYKIKSGYIVYGTQEQLASVKSFVSGFSTQLEVRTLTTKLEAKDIETIISVYDPNVKNYKIADKVYLVGKKESLDKIEKEILQFDVQSEYNIINGKLLIEVTNKNLTELVMKVSSVFKEQAILVDELKTNVTLRLLVADFKSFLEYLQTFGVTYKQTDDVYLIYSSVPQQAVFQGQQQTQPVQPEEVIVKDGLITINASNKNVTDIVSQVLSKLGKSYKIDDVQTKIFSVSLNNIDYETFKSVFSEWVDIKEIGNVVYVSKPVSVSESKVSVKNGKISVKIDNEPLGNVIKSVFESFGYPIIFSKQINTTATMSLSEIDFDTFTSILLNYGIAIKKSGNVYVVDTTPEATKTKTTYTFNVTRGADKVKALIEFYGGKAMVNTDAGIVIAYDLDPKNVDDIRNVIDKVSKVRIVSIETKVVDESLLNSLGFDISTILSSADYLSIGTGGLSLKFKIVDFMDLQALWNKIIDEAQVQIKTSGSNVAAPYGTSGGGKLLANPNIMAKSGEQARIFIGDSIPVVITSEGRQTMNYLEAGIELRITPSINLDDTIDLDLYTTVGNFDYSVVVGGFPKQNKREVQTKITLKNGQTLIIGGLAREEVSKSEWKIPILGDLPIIGWLFKGMQEKTEQRNIVIFLTAKIIEQ
ncbi:type II secretory pathway, component PulD [Fervidobacterium pennivorans DSM 9078]|uniref:Type II secretory pathway, component PulD n=1 Tax=Fervidobacterium pennivorans (strain DSM 9078 / Ven5) TaxID=771875 RepID=H9UDZ1_FERPD|nr:type II and III secretion system protein [Fervidobacterium pennivorans]AFG35734.1 type II secretory pathway, component PulD [Fervidobacterium pennivorans DSM 9078]